MRIRLEEITVYTLKGKRYLYKLGDMAYGEWLIFKDKLPIYYLNIFDEKYGNVDESITKNPYQYLKERFKIEKQGYSLTQSIRGIWSSKINDKWIEIEKLPIGFLKDRYR